MGIEFALLTAITVFSEREGLSEVAKVASIQDHYTLLLQTHTYLHHSPPQSSHLGSLLSLLTDLRTLRATNTQHCFSYKTRDIPLPPLLQELWDIPKFS